MVIELIKLRMSFILEILTTLLVIMSKMIRIMTRLVK